MPAPIFDSTQHPTNPALHALGLLCLGIALLLASCAETTRLTDQHFPPRAEDAPVEIIMNRAPDRDYIEVALVREESEMTTNKGRLLESLKRQAREVGAHAIIIRTLGEENVQGPVTAHTNPYTGITTYNSQTYAAGVAEGVAIRWREAESGDLP